MKEAEETETSGRHVCCVRRRRGKHHLSGHLSFLPNFPQKKIRKERQVADT
jgi:hypothetical protein